MNQELSHSLQLYNQAMRAVYAWQTKHLRTGNKPYEGSLHLAIKKRFQLDDYYANSAVQQANALRTSQKELQVLYLKQVDVTLQSIQKKLKKRAQQAHDITENEAVDYGWKTEAAQKNGVSGASNRFRHGICASS
ncbi:hypothetical protein GCM10020331_056080 [Ectobacillus funiculus]